MLLRCGVPKVDPTCNATEMEVEKRISLLHKLEASHLKETGAMINEKWTQKQVEDAGGRGTALCNTEPPQEFWEAMYYDVMFELYGHKLKNCQRQVVNGETYEKESETPYAKRARGIHITPTNDADFGMSGLFNRLGVDSSDAASFGQEMEVDFISARCVLDDALPSSRHKFQGYVQEFDHEPRSVSIKFLPGKARSPVKSGNVEQERYVMNASMFDSTGPVSVTLWGELCGIFISLMQSVNPQVIVQLHNVRVTPVPRNAFNGSLLTSMNVLQSIDPIGTRSGTEVTIVPNATSPYMIKNIFVPPPFPVCLADFRSVRSKLQAPFRVTLKGTVVDVREMDHSLQGENKLTFDLIDAHGAWVTCCALGRHAANRHLCTGSEIIIYFGTGRPPIGSSSGMIWVLKDGVIVYLRSHIIPPSKTMQLHVSAKVDE